MAATVWTCLVRIKSKDDDRSHLIEKTTFTIGRTEDADLPLTEPSVSRRHLDVELRGPLVFIKDLKSGNGTFVNGSKIEPGVEMALQPGDKVRLGTTDHEFSIAAIPKPFELLDLVAKEKSLSIAMKDAAAQAERRAKELVERERLSLKIESEKVMQEARKEAEIIKTQALIELQTKKQSLESDIASLKHEAAVAASQERLKYAKDADQFMAEAQKKIAQDYEDASMHIEQQMQKIFREEFCDAPRSRVEISRHVTRGPNRSGPRPRERDRRSPHASPRSLKKNMRQRWRPFKTSSRPIWSPSAKKF